MKKFLILFCASEPMSSFMNRSTAEERGSGLEAWTNWFNSIDKNIKFEFGAVIETVDTIESNNAPLPHESFRVAQSKSIKVIKNATARTEIRQIQSFGVVC